MQYLQSKIMKKNIQIYQKKLILKHTFLLIFYTNLFVFFLKLLVCHLSMIINKCGRAFFFKLYFLSTKQPNTTYTKYLIEFMIGLKKLRNTTNGRFFCRATLHEKAPYFIFQHHYPQIFSISMQTVVSKHIRSINKQFISHYLLQNSPSKII